MKNIENYSLCGFRDAITFKSVDDFAIKYVEKFISSKLPSILEKLKKENGAESTDFVKYFGEIFDACPNSFTFQLGDRVLIKEMAAYVKRIVEGNENDSGLGYFRAAEKNENIEICSNSNANEDEVRFPTKTHYFLRKMLTNADRNIHRRPGGYRYDDETKTIASYFRMLAGPLAYQTIQNNLPCALPSMPSTNRYIYKTNCRVTEGILRTKELHLFLKDRNLDPIVSLSEDATRIVGRIQYSTSTNQIIGFVLPLSRVNGLPIPFSFPARSEHEIMKHFQGKNVVSSFVNVIMAQPIGETKIPAFCLLIFGSDSRYSAHDVSKRWQFVINDLNAAGITVLTFSSDSDPKYNAAMRILVPFWKSPSCSEKKENFCCDDIFENRSMKTTCVQDTTHIATKLRNLFLKTMYNARKLPFGKYFIKHSHLQELIEKFTKDKHNLAPSVLNPLDKQNFDSVLRMTEENVINLLVSNIVGSQATVMFLRITRNIIDSYLDWKLQPLQRIYKIWYAVFVIRIWRNFIASKTGSTLKDNFMSSNCYTCIEINAHSLIACMVQLKNVNSSHLFQPQQYGSQQCESIFRQIRSFTSTYSTVANCSVKEIVERISKIQLQNDIISKSGQNFKFPRIGKSSSSGCSFELPSADEIRNEIRKCKRDAVIDAMRVGLITADEFSQVNLTCQVKPYLVKEKKSMIATIDKNGKPVKTIFGNIQMKNYASKFEGERVNQTSPFVELFDLNKTDSRFICKKTSFCWLLRCDYTKLSSDRLQRVQSGKRSRKSKRKTKKGVIVKSQFYSKIRKY